MGLRSIAMEFNCCIITATQSDSGAYSQLRQGRGNFSEDKRKASHVSALIGLNKPVAVGGQPLEGDVYLLQWLFRRHGKSVRDVVVGGCLDVARPWVVSKFSEMHHSSQETGGRE